MKSRAMAVSITAAVVLFVAAHASALEQTYSPSPSNLYNFPHDKNYIWGIDVSAFAALNIYEVELKLIQITNWDNNENHLYMHLIDDAAVGITIGNDSGTDFVNAFTGLGPFIADYQDMNGKDIKETVTYKFSDLGLVDDVNLFKINNIIAIAFDPDCHFWNCGVELTIKGEPSNAVEPISWGQLKASFQE